MIRIGTSGFSFPDWRGTVYPKGLQPKDAFDYYLNEFRFDCVEINSTYYTLVSAKSFESMEKKTGPDFEFAVKGYRGVTHDPFDPRIAARPGVDAAMEAMDKFMYSVQPLKEKGKLGAVLLQFPVFFAPSEQSKEYILRCKERAGGAPLVVEFRNSAWNKPDSYDFLRKNGLSFCVVDEPKLPRLMPFINEVTAGPAYLRLHGRNKNWFSAPASERYDYMYSDKELGEFLPEIDKMNKLSAKTFVFFNNCHAGSAVKNAMQLRQLLAIGN